MWLIAIGLATLAGAATAAIHTAGANAASLPPALTIDDQHLHVPDHARAWLAAFKKWATARAIPLDVLLAWAALETGFNATSYNPEIGAMPSWAKNIASNPQRWAKNPDFAKAVAVDKALTAGTATAAAIAAADQVKALADKMWSFGSIGILQVARNSAAEADYPAAAANSGLLDLDTNLRAGTGEIAYWRTAMFGARKVLVDAEWATVRAAYVLGGGGVAKYPDAADAKRALFLGRLSAIRGRVA